MGIQVREADAVGTTRLTARQELVLRVMGEHFARVGVWPSYDEIAAAIGAASKYGVYGHLVRLQAKGYVRMCEGGRTRSAVIVGMAERVAPVARRYLAELLARPAGEAAHVRRNDEYGTASHP